LTIVTLARCWLCSQCWDWLSARCHKAGLC